MTVIKNSRNAREGRRREGPYPALKMAGQKGRNSMASLRSVAQNVLEEAREGIAWIALFKEGRGWNAECFWQSADRENGAPQFKEEDVKRLREILATDGNAIFVNGYYSNLGSVEEMIRDTLANALRWQYACQYNRLADTPELAAEESVTADQPDASIPSDLSRLGEQLEEDCPENDCTIYRNIYRMAQDFRCAMGKVSGYPRQVLKRELRKSVTELRQMYIENYAVQKYRKTRGMTGLEFFKAPGRTAEEIADVISSSCPPVIPADCDKIPCHECWLHWLTEGPPSPKASPDEKPPAACGPGYLKTLLQGLDGYMAEREEPPGEQTNPDNGISPSCLSEDVACQRCFERHNKALLNHLAAGARE